MSSYRYCKTCSAGMDKPTPDEAVEGVHSCPACGENNSQRQDFNDFLIDLSNFLIDLSERLETLEKGEGVR